MSNNNIAVALKKCNNQCHLVNGYVGLKIIKFATEMGYKKCKVCECYFLFPNNSNIIYCQCCHMKLRTKTSRRNMETKIKALQFKKGILNNDC